MQQYHILYNSVTICLFFPFQPSSQSHTIRRRCLVFDKAETHKRKLISDSSGTCSVSMMKEKIGDGCYNTISFVRRTKDRHNVEFS